MRANDVDVQNDVTFCSNATASHNHNRHMPALPCDNCDCAMQCVLTTTFPSTQTTAAEGSKGGHHHLNRLQLPCGICRQQRRCYITTGQREAGFAPGAAIAGSAGAGRASEYQCCAAGGGWLSGGGVQGRTSDATYGSCTDPRDESVTPLPASETSSSGSPANRTCASHPRGVMRYKVSAQLPHPCLKARS